jgi:DNA-binding PadR family transcriptional regulator
MARPAADDPTPFLPLSTAHLYILLALADEDRHGYGIMQEVARQSGRGYKLGPGTLYDNLRKMLDAGTVEETEKLAPDDDPRRRYYRLSRFGRNVLKAEIARLESIVVHAKPLLRPATGRR